MTSPVNMLKFVEALPSRQRGRAAIVFTHEHRGQKEWAAELARQTGSDHIDLLDFFFKDAALGSTVGQFSVSRLFEYLQAYRSTRVLIVSGLEFLKATWSGQASAGEQFASRVETWSQRPSLLFVLQHDRNMAARKFRRFPQYTFIVDQKETLAL